MAEDKKLKKNEEYEKSLKEWEQEQIKAEAARIKIEFNVRGAEPILFKEGGQTGDMTEPGLSIDTVWCSDKKRYGGCINREETIQLRDFLNQCILLWRGEKEEEGSQ